jgi:hypothetical protein
MSVPPSQGPIPPFFNVQAYGATGNGSTDDAFAIQAAISAASVLGGVVYFPCSSGEVYAIGSTLVVAARYPVTLMSNMVGGGALFNSGRSSYIRPLPGFAPATDMIRFHTPTSDRHDAGGGALIGLSLYDPTSRGVAIRSGARCEDFCLSVVRDCEFHYLRGAALVTDFCVMSSFDRVVIRYCGDAGVSALQVGVTSGGGYVSQSATFRDFRMEVNQGAPYVSLPPGDNQESNKFIGFGFEADTAVPASSQPFLSCAANRNDFVAIHMARNDATSIIVTGNRNKFVGMEVYADSGANPQLVTAAPGTYNAFVNCAFTGNISNLTGDSVLSAGFVSFTDCDFYAGGRVRVTGPRAHFANCRIRGGVSAAGYALDLQGGESTVSGGEVSANAGGGLRLQGDNSSISGTLVIANAGIGVRVEGTNHLVQPRSSGNRGGDVSIAGTSVLSLDGGDLAAGSSVTAPRVVGGSAVLTDTAIVAVDASRANSFVLTPTGARTIGAPVNSLPGQRITVTIIQDSAGARSITWDPVYKVRWSNTGNTANRRSSASFIFDGVHWNQDGAQAPWV